MLCFSRAFLVLLSPSPTAIAVTQSLSRSYIAAVVNGKPVAFLLCFDLAMGENSVVRPIKVST